MDIEGEEDGGTLHMYNEDGMMTLQARFEGVGRKKKGNVSVMEGELAQAQCMHVCSYHDAMSSDY
jgi:hypothetical protein